MTKDLLSLTACLFVVHREEILKQSRFTFRNILRDQNFGELLTGHEKPESYEQLFCSIQEVSAKIYSVYLKYVSPEDIHVYSIDEVFIDATSYLKLYKLTAHDFAMRMIRDVLQTTEVEQDLLSPITSVKVRLVEEDGNAFSILGRCRAAMRKAGYPQVFIDTFVTEATAGNYDDLLATVMRYWVVE